MLNEQLILKMIDFNKGDAKRIQHFIKVYEYAHLIGKLEGLDEKVQKILDIASIMHDIGIRPSEEKYGRCDGKLQEQEGPIVAQKMLSELGFENYLIERICYLIGHHHTYTNVDGLDYQVLIEADFLVNLYEDDANRSAVMKAYENIFRTQTGRNIFREMFWDGEEP